MNAARRINDEPSSSVLRKPHPMKPITKLSDDEWLALVKQAVAMPEVPPHLVQEAVALWSKRRPTPRGLPQLQRRMAVLSFDSWAGVPVATGMRAMPSEVRQMFFSAERFDIDLRITPGADGFTLSGQLFGTGSEREVELVLDSQRGGKAMQRGVTFDASSGFRIDQLSGGIYVVVVRLGEHEIVLPSIEVGQSRNSSGP